MSVKKTLSFFVPAAIVLATVLGFVFFKGSSDSPVKQTVPENSDFYVGIQLIEVNPTQEDGSVWDGINDSGPDLYVQFHWQGQRIFQSSVKEDSLIAHWSEAEFDLRDYALKGKPTSIDDVISGARIQVRKDAPLRVVVYEDDLLRDDFVGEFTVDLTTLTEGTHVIQNPTPQIKRVELRVLPFSALPSLFSSGVAE